VKIDKKNLSLDEFLKDLDLNNLEQDMLWSDYEDEEAFEKEENKKSYGDIENSNKSEESSGKEGLKNTEEKKCYELWYLAN